MGDSEPSTFHVQLVCEESKTTTAKTLTLQSLPDTFLGVKKAVEEKFSIPVCVQTLFHQSTKVTDAERLLSYYVRSGDTFQVAYPIEGDCKMVIRVVEWLKKLSNAFALHSNMEESNTGDFSFQFDQFGYSMCSQLMSGEYMEVARDLALNLVFPWTDRTKYINKLHMDSLGAVQLVMHVYKCVIHARLNRTSLYRGYYLEVLCAIFVANFTQTFPLRRRILEHGGLDYCVHTFVRISAKDLLDDTNNAIEVSLYAICNLSELPECQLNLARRFDVTKQALEVGLSSMHTLKTAIVSTSYFLCLAQCLETHQHLLQPEIVGSLLEVCKMRRVEGTTDEATALESYACVVVAQMILGSSKYLLKFTEPLLTEVALLMEEVCKSDPVGIREYEIKEGLIWGTFLPFLSYLYNPSIVPYSEHESMTKLITKLQLLSVRVLVHSLHNALGREDHLKILIEEGLVDYLAALSWHVPDCCTDAARNMIKDISKLTPLKPPSLCSLAKAKLAKDEMGLKRVLNMKSVSDIFCNW